MLRNFVKFCKQAADGLFSAAPLGPKPIVLYSFNSQKVVDQWHVFTDSYFGGKSQASFTYNQQEEAAEFSGRCSVEQSEDAELKRAGYCVANSKVTHIGDYSDLSGFGHLVYRVKGDGRTYIATVRTDSIVGTGGDIWQAPFQTRHGVWDDVAVPISALALTYKGQIVERRLEFQADKVIGVGISAAAEATATPDLGSTQAQASSSGSSADGSAEGQSQQQQQHAELAPEGEQFRIFIKEIRAEGEM